MCTVAFHTIELTKSQMNAFSPFCVLNCACEEALAWVKNQLSQAGFRVLQTFDLHTARHTEGNLPCPLHGRSKCDCQLVVLLIYGSTNEPATLMLQGNDGQTWLSLANNTLHLIDPMIRSSIQQALQPQ